MGPEQDLGGRLRAPFIQIPLADAETQIRLLELEHGIGDEELVGNLFVYERSALPEFEAISYTWGSVEPSATITLNNTAFRITLNSWIALRQVRLPDAKRLLWMDTICIDQENQYEKGHQVQGMESIYRGAKTVLVSLGGEDVDGGFLFEWIRKFNRAYQVQGFRRNPLFRSRGYPPERRDRTKHQPEVWEAWKTSLLDWYSDLTPGGFKKLIAAITAFGECSYWTRLWVYLELTLSANDVVFYGSSVCKMKLWYKFVSITYADGVGDIIRLMRSMEVGHPSNLLYKAILPIERFSTNVARARANELTYYGGFQMNELCEMGCVEPRDRIFALIPLVDWEDRGLTSITVDYGRSRVDLALECLPFCTGVFDIKNLLAALEVSCKHSDTDVATFLQRRRSATKAYDPDEIAPTAGICVCHSPKYIKYTRFHGFGGFAFGRGFTIQQNSDGELLGGAFGSRNDHESRLRRHRHRAGEAHIRMISSSYQAVLGAPSSKAAGQIVAVVPANVSHGDIVVTSSKIEERPKRRKLCAGLVLRENQYGIYKMISHALVTTDFPGVSDATSLLALDARFAADDALAFALEGLCYSSKCPHHLVSTFEHCEHSILATAPTLMPYSSYAVHDFEDYAEPVGIVCAECGGFLDEQYQETNRQMKQWRLRAFQPSDFSDKIDLGVKA